MCHGITWFHVICGHADPSLSTLILCHDSLLTGDSCLPCIELAWFPLKGLCRICREQEKRERKRRRRQIALTAYAAFNEQCGWERKSPDMLVTENNHTQFDEHSAGRRYDGWFGGQDMTEYQPETDGLDMLVGPSKHEMIENWLNHPDLPVPEMPGSSDTEYRSPELQNHTNFKIQRSSIPVPARKNTGLMHQPKRQNSHIPVPVNRVQKTQHSQPQNDLEGIDGVELFDRITF